MPDFIPEDKFSPDIPPNAAPEGTPNFVPDKEFSPDDESLIEQAKSGVEGLERGATLGLSDVLRTKIEPNYLPAELQEKPLDIARRQEDFPVTAALGNIAGGTGLLIGTGGVGGALSSTAGTAAKLGAMAAEGGIFGAGNAVSDYALGDPTLNAQKVLAHIGTGAALGLGFGILSKAAEAALPAAMRSTSKLVNAIKGTDSSAGSGGVAGGAVPLATEAAPILDAPATGVKPTSYQDIVDKVRNAKYTGDSIELPGKQILLDAANRVEMMNPVNHLQLNSLGDQTARDTYNTFKEMPGPEGDGLRGYESLQKNELTNRTDNAIKELSPDVPPVPDAVEGGNKAIEAFSDQYQQEKSELEKAFSELKETPLTFKADAMTGAIEHMTNAVPGVASMFDTAAEDGVKIKPYKTSFGIDKATYSAVKEAVEALKENPTDFESLQNIRNGLKQHIDIMAQGQAPQQIRALGKGLMDFMQEAVENSAPDSGVRETFKRYAINEQERQVIEKAFGASVGSQEFGAISKIKPEVIGDKIFNNTATVDAAKRILEPKKFNEILANWLAENRARVTDKGVFSSNKWNTFLTRNQDALNSAFSDNPEALQKLKDMTTIMRMLPDAPSINPSGTAKTLMAMLKNVHGVGDAAGTALHFLKDKTIGELQKQVNLSNLNEQLAGRATKSSMLNEIGKMVSKSTDKISSGARSIFSDNGARSVGISAAVNFGDNDYEKNVKKIQSFSNNPKQLMDHLAAHTDSLYEAAPSITQGIHNAITSSVQFLDSKIPKPITELPLSSDWAPTKSQKNTFNRYYGAVNDPISVLKQIKDGTLSNEAMEALTVTQPHLLDEMQSKVMEHINPKNSHKLPYSTKIALSKFLNQPLDEGMLPQALAANQAALAMPAQRQDDKIRSHMGAMKNSGLSDRYRTRTQIDSKP